MRRVVVTGLGALTPIGNNIQGYLEALQKGISGANVITRFDATKFKTHFACEVKDFDPKKLEQCYIDCVSKVKAYKVEEDIEMIQRNLTMSDDIEEKRRLRRLLFELKSKANKYKTGKLE